MAAHQRTEGADAAAFVMSPPLRPREHQDALWEALGTGVLQTLATDHCPFLLAEKNRQAAIDFTRVASGCGGCTLCRDHCPSGAITGAEWSRGNPFVELVRLGACRDYQAAGRRTAGKPTCGLCVTICPHGRRMGTDPLASPEKARTAGTVREIGSTPIFPKEKTA